MTKDAAGCVIFDDMGRVLLVHQTYGPKKWDLPGGVVEEGESAWDAVVRECKEEVNTVIEPLLCGLYFLPHRDAYIFVFKALKYAGVPAPDGTEIDKIGYFALDQLPVPISNFAVQRIKDAASGAGRVILREQHLKDYRLLES